MRQILKSLAFGAFMLAQTSSAWACPMCKFALETEDSEPRAYMISILFMMGMISTLFACVAVLLWWVSKHEKMVMNAAGYQHLFENGVSHPHLAQTNPDR
jgi:hypothetical protein